MADNDPFATPLPVAPEADPFAVPLDKAPAPRPKWDPAKFNRWAAYAHTNPEEYETAVKNLEADPAQAHWAADLRARVVPRKVSFGQRVSDTMLAPMFELSSLAHRAAQYTTSPVMDVVTAPFRDGPMWANTEEAKAMADVHAIRATQRREAAAQDAGWAERNLLQPALQSPLQAAEMLVPMGEAAIAARATKMLLGAPAIARLTVQNPQLVTKITAATHAALANAKLTLPTTAAAISSGADPGDEIAKLIAESTISTLFPGGMEALANPAHQKAPTLARALLGGVADEAPEEGLQNAASYLIDTRGRGDVSGFVTALGEGAVQGVAGSVGPVAMHHGAQQFDAAMQEANFDRAIQEAAVRHAATDPGISPSPVFAPENAPSQPTPDIDTTDAALTRDEYNAHLEGLQNFLPESRVTPAVDATDDTPMAPEQVAYNLEHPPIDTQRMTAPLPKNLPPVLEPTPALAPPETRAARIAAQLEVGKVKEKAIAHERQGAEIRKHLADPRQAAAYAIAAGEQQMESQPDPNPPEPDPGYVEPPAPIETLRKTAAELDARLAAISQDIKQNPAIAPTLAAERVQLVAARRQVDEQAMRARAGVAGVAGLEAMAQHAKTEVETTDPAMKTQAAERRAEATKGVNTVLAQEAGPRRKKDEKSPPPGVQTPLPATETAAIDAAEAVLNDPNATKEQKAAAEKVVHDIVEGGPKRTRTMPLEMGEELAPHRRMAVPPERPALPAEPAAAPVAPKPEHPAVEEFRQFLAGKKPTRTFVPATESVPEAAPGEARVAGETADQHQSRIEADEAARRDAAAKASLAALPTDVSEGRVEAPVKAPESKPVRHAPTAPVALPSTAATGLGGFVEQEPNATPEQRARTTSLRAKREHTMVAIPARITLTPSEGDGKGGEIMSIAPLVDEFNVPNKTYGIPHFYIAHTAEGQWIPMEARPTSTDQIVGNIATVGGKSGEGLRAVVEEMQKRGREVMASDKPFAEKLAEANRMQTYLREQIASGKKRMNITWPYQVAMTTDDAKAYLAGDADAMSKYVFDTFEEARDFFTQPGQPGAEMIEKRVAAEAKPTALSNAEESVTEALGRTDESGEAVNSGITIGSRRAMREDVWKFDFPPGYNSQGELVDGVLSGEVSLDALENPTHRGEVEKLAAQKWERKQAASETVVRENARFENLANEFIERFTADQKYQDEYKRAVLNLEQKYREILVPAEDRFREDNRRKAKESRNPAKEGEFLAKTVNPFIAGFWRDKKGNWRKTERGNRYDGSVSQALMGAISQLPTVPGLRSLPIPHQRLVRHLQMQFPDIGFVVTPLENAKAEFVIDQGRATIYIDPARLATNQEFVTAMAHEVTHVAMAYPGIRRAVIDSIGEILGAEKLAAIKAAMVNDPRFAKLLRANKVEATSKEGHELLLDEALAHAVSYAIEEGDVELAQAVLGAAPFNNTLSIKTAINTLGVIDGIPTAAKFLDHHFREIANWIDNSIDPTGEKAAAREYDQPENMETEEGRAYKGAVKRTKTKATKQIAEIAQHTRALSRIALLATHRAEYHALYPTSFNQLSDQQAASYRKLIERLTYRDPGEMTGTSSRTRQSPLEPPGSPEPPGETIYDLPEDPANPERDARNEARIEALSKASAERAPRYEKGAWEKTVIGARRLWRSQFVKYRELGDARDIVEAEVTLALDNAHAAAKRAKDIGNGAAATVFKSVINTNTDKARASAQLFTVHAVMRDVQDQIDQLIATGEFVPGTHAYPMMSEDGKWDATTMDPAEFSALKQSLHRKMLADPVAREIDAQFNLLFDHYRARLEREGVVEKGALSPYWFHRINLEHNSVEAQKERARQAEILLGLPKPSGASGSVLTSRVYSLSPFSTNPVEAISHSVQSIVKVLGAHGLVRATVNASIHNIVAPKVEARNAEEFEKVLGALETKDDAETRASKLKLFEVFGSLLRSVHRPASTAWMTDHANFLSLVEVATDPTNPATVAERIVGLDPKAIAAVARDAHAQSPPFIRDALEKALIPWHDPLNALSWPAEAVRNYVPAGFDAAPAPYHESPATPRKEGMPTSNFNELVQEVLSAAAELDRNPALILPEGIAQEVNPRRVWREEAVKKQGKGVKGAVKKLSVIGQLLTPFTHLSYLFNNHVGNASQMLLSDPGAMSYAHAASALFHRFHTDPNSMTEAEATLMGVMQQRFLLEAGAAMEANTSSPMAAQLASVLLNPEQRTLWSKVLDKTFHPWMRVSFKGRRAVDDVPRIAVAMREVEQTPYLYNQLGSVLAARPMNANWRQASKEWVRKGLYLPHSVLGAVLHNPVFRSQFAGANPLVAAMAKAQDDAAHTGSPIEDTNAGHEIARAMSVRVEGTLGNYNVLPELMETWLGRGLLNPFTGYTSNALRMTAQAISNDLAERSVRGKVRAGARVTAKLTGTAAKLALYPVFVHFLNAALRGMRGDDDEYQKWLAQRGSNSYTQLYWGNGKTITISSVAMDLVRYLGFDTLPTDVANSIRSGDWSVPLVKEAVNLTKPLTDPQLGLVQSFLAFTPYNLNRNTGVLQPAYDPWQSAVQPFGLANAYSRIFGNGETTTGDVFTGLIARKQDPREGQIAYAKQLVAQYNAANHYGRGAVALTIDATGRLRASMRRAVQRGDIDTATALLEELNAYADDPDSPRKFTAENVLKSFGASDVRHGLAPGMKDRTAEYEKFVRWMNPAEREIFLDAQKFQAETLSPWHNPDLRALLLDTANTPERKMAAAKVLANGLAAEVHEYRADTKSGIGASVEAVAAKLHLPVEQVQAAIRLQRRFREMATKENKGKDTTLKAATIEETARAAGFMR